MATIREDFFSALTKGAKWDVGVSINRTNPLPLDQYSVFESETKLDEYIGGAFAYPGQIVAVIGADETKIYYLDQNKAKQPVGIVPSGDSKTIEVTAQGAISLLGAAAAEDGTLPMLENGALVWKTLEDIGAGDGNDNTTYVFTLGEDGKSISIKTLFNGQPIKDAEGKEIDPQVIALDVYTKSEVDTKISTTLADYATTESVNTALADYTDTDTLTGLLADKADKAEYDQTVLDLDALEARVDAFLSGTGAEDALDSLQELIAYINTHDDADINGILASIQAIENKLVLGTYVDGEETKEYATVKAYVEAAIAALRIADYTKTEDLETYLTGKFDAYGAASSALDDAKDYADEELAKKVDKVEGYGLLSAADQEKLNKLTLDDGELSISGSVEAGSVKNLDTWLTTNRDTVAGLYPSADATKLGGIAAGAQVNVLEAVKVNGTALAIEGKAVNIDLTPYAKQSDLDIVSGNANKGIADALAAQTKANEAAGVASANTTLISGLDTRLGTAEGKIDKNTTDIANHATEFATLKGRVDGHDTAIAGKADKSSVEAIAATVGEHTGKFTTLETTTIPALQAAINGKADSTALTAEIDRAKAAEEANAAEIAKIPGAIATAKSEAIAEVTALANGAVDANTKAIAKLNGEAGAEGSVATIADARIAAALAGADADFDTLKEMSDWLSTHKGSAAEMNTAILKNAADIKTINETTIPAAITTANGYTDSAIAALGIASYTVKEVVSGHDAITVKNENGKVTISFADEIVLNGGAAN